MSVILEMAAARSNVVWSVRVDIAVVDSLDAATQVCSIAIPVLPLNVTQRALYVLTYLLVLALLRPSILSSSSSLVFFVPQYTSSYTRGPGELKF